MSFKTSMIAASVALGCVAAPSFADTYEDPNDKGLLGGDCNAWLSICPNVYVFGGAGYVREGDLTYDGTSRDRSSQAAGEAGLGVRFTKNIRFDAAFQFNNFVIDAAAVEKFSVYNTLYTLYYDFDLGGSSWKPYLGYGWGRAAMKNDGSTSPEDENVGVDQFKLGVTYDTARNMDVFGEIVWQNYDDARTNTKKIDAFDQTKIQVGLRYSFF